VQQTSQDCAAEKVIVCGYSAGGFGALQMGSHAPDLFDAVISVAGHGKGTLEVQAFGAPQPESSRIFQDYLDQHAPRLATTAVIIVHARRDSVSSFKDAEAIAEAIQAHGGNCELVAVPDDKANSDSAGKKKKSKAGHSYYFYSLLNESSEEIIHCRLRAACGGGSVVQEGGVSQAGEVGEVTTDASSTAVVAKAQARLRINKARSNFPAIARLKADCGLTDEVELALKLLMPEHLGEVLAGWADIKAKVRQRKDSGNFLISVVSQLDPSVEELVQGIIALEAQSGSAGSDAQAVDGEEEVLAAARGRLQAPKGKAEMAGIKRLTSRHGLGEEVELALRMLSTAHLKEILAGESQLTQKMAEVDDKGGLMLWLVSQLDPDVEALVKKIVEIDGQSGQEAEQKAPEGQEQSPEEAVAEAKARLQANKSAASLNAIASFRTLLSLGDEVELAMRMLAPAKLAKLTARKLALKRELVGVQDRNQHVLFLISELDPSVEALVRRFLNMDSGTQDSAEGTRADDRSRSPPRWPVRPGLVATAKAPSTTPRPPAQANGRPGLVATAKAPGTTPRQPAQANGRPPPRGTLAKRMPGWL